MKHHNCGTPLGKINGRTLRWVCKARGLSYKNYSETSWVEVCPSCDVSLLQTKAGVSLPFLLNGVMRTVTDLDAQSGPIATPIMFGCFPMSLSALNSALNLLSEEDSTTSAVETLGHCLKSMLINDPENLDAKRAVYLFSEQVCQWGRGERVWANLLRHHGQLGLQQLLFDWLVSAANNNDLLEAISQGAAIKGLGVSFASKHLRMLDPTQFPVLDAVLSEGLGIALNRRGYQLFQSMLINFQSEHSIEFTIAKLEAAIFWLVRQNVRSVS